MNVECPVCNVGYSSLNALNEHLLDYHHYCIPPRDKWNNPQ